MRSRLVPVIAIGLAVASAVAPATAAPKKPKTITKSYTMQLLPLPLPPSGDTCQPADGAEGVTKHTETLKAPAAGSLVVEIKGFSGDWDITVLNSAGKTMATGGPTVTGGGAPAMNATETLKLKLKKAQTVSIVSCNFLGTPDASGKFTFTYLG